ncbi:LEAF RUST 10 DISEASE-RESISTANCE LOCUS RECEPTOR-LIKE PROTEIN KINASE-like 2.1 [Frankliniella fusca]|uniref:LEAF RUST 10 DISEASE-RESISTANCE LOCUS RECEPTOR-LIKE PROTEIN KINASE-like 2.1 n=1 Tax=Frankliniella fusca TaxID=407009 RepID=A0AAE1L8W1_9NEOP|nr:LEAF RUST 10 DISEASE-RESISTANCE LOCUS RECEPTOR-LIKE PROTEIN KINASE-like 2.1 [Frankliniella fusca]
MASEPKTLVMLLDQSEALKLIREQIGTTTTTSQSEPKTAVGVILGAKKPPAKPLKPRPIWREHQLIGDSMMGRLASYLIGHKVPYNRETHRRQLGLITHGQTTGRLIGTVHSANSPPLAPKVIVMIGTNDIAHRCKEVVVLTLPPVPAMEASFENLSKFNTFIKENSVLEHKNIKVVDTTVIFGASTETVKLDLFEK